ncbi:hypothetical protein ATC03_16560 [Agromyces aureus]|uniref:Uncharacterized protein n=1 Tax=Agromyces aureus TaxID=453304 RepID=A0A191WIN9_9MICO|nr:hypothetical protein ATC03_16560 [Agromyces aureus]
MVLVGCAPTPGPDPAAQSRPVVDGFDDYDDGLDVTTGDDADIELTDGYFADDEDALAVAVATLEAHLDEQTSAPRKGDVSGRHLHSIPVPPMGLDIQQLLAAEVFSTSAVETRVDVENAFIVRRTEDAHGAIVDFAFCRVETATESPVVPVRREFAVSAASTAEDPRHLQVTAILNWVGEPFC